MLLERRRSVEGDRTPTTLVQQILLPIAYKEVEQSKRNRGFNYDCWMQTSQLSACTRIMP